jgi:branched-chain amino acid transport system substrate-binding protein
MRRISLKIVILFTLISLLTGLLGNTISAETSDPIVNTLDGQTIYLGYIASSTINLETAVPYIKQIIEPDLNEFAGKLGYSTSFEFVIDDAASDSNTHLEKVQAFKEMGINIFIGGGWSAQAQASLAYVNDNNMLMWSPSATSPILAIADDNLYRMCPDDTKQGPAIAEMLRSFGIDAIIVIQRGDGWADGLYSTMDPAFASDGGVILDRITYDPSITDFTYVLQEAERWMAANIDGFGSDHVAIQLITFTEGATIAYQAVDYPTIYSVPWFGSDGTALAQNFIDDSPEQAGHLHIFSTLAAPTESSKYWDLYDRYYALTGQSVGYYGACQYDIAWVLAEAILEAQSTDADKVIPLLETVAYNHFGASGWCLLNEAGDRAAANYQIWGFGDIGNGLQNVQYGFYDSITGKATWNKDYLDYNPPPSPTPPPFVVPEVTNGTLSTVTAMIIASIMLIITRNRFVKS